jgi:hypothetical protein
MQSQQMFVIVDPVNPQNNTARNSHRTPEILSRFGTAFSQLKGLVQAEYVKHQQALHAHLARTPLAG